MSFKKTKEDFKCQNCGFVTIGNGYTNHCPECLWSKHVDIFPGDRKNVCGGLMKPVNVIKKGKEYTIIHKCIVCGKEKLNKASKKDNFQILVQIAAENTKEFLN